MYYHKNFESYVWDIDNYIRTTKSELRSNTCEKESKTEEKYDFLIEKSDRIIQNMHLLLQKDGMKNNVFCNSLPDNVICIAIGDIEGQVDKVRYIKSLINNNPKLIFLFLGDLFDDISYCSDKFKDSLSTLRELECFFVKKKLKFPESDLKDIKFGRKKFSKITRKVIFIAGNSECDCLFDVTDNKCEEKDGYYLFGSGKYQKKFTFNQLQLLYRYFSSCYGSILYETPMNSVLFRHARYGFSNKYYNVEKYVDQYMEWEKKDNDLLVIGHEHNFGKYSDGRFMLDTSPDQNDLRLAIISQNKKGFSARVLVNQFQEFQSIEINKKDL